MTQAVTRGTKEFGRLCLFGTPHIYYSMYKHQLLPILANIQSMPLSYQSLPLIALVD